MSFLEWKPSHDCSFKSIIPKLHNSHVYCILLLALCWQLYATIQKNSMTFIFMNTQKLNDLFDVDAKLESHKIFGNKNKLKLTYEQ